MLECNENIVKRSIPKLTDEMDILEQEKLRSEKDYTVRFHSCAEDCMKGHLDREKALNDKPSNWQA